MAGGCSETVNRNRKTARPIQRVALFNRHPSKNRSRHKQFKVTYASD